MDITVGLLLVDIIAFVVFLVLTITAYKIEEPALIIWAVVMWVLWVLRILSQTGVTDNGINYINNIRNTRVW